MVDKCGGLLKQGLVFLILCLLYIKEPPLCYIFFKNLIRINGKCIFRCYFVYEILAFFGKEKKYQKNKKIRGRCSMEDFYIHFIYIFPEYIFWLLFIFFDKNNNNNNNFLFISQMSEAKIK